MRNLARYSKALCAGGILVLALAACQSGAPLPQSGRYQGNLVVKKDGHLVAVPVTAEVSPLQGGHGTIGMQGLDGSRRPAVELSDVGSDALTLSVPEATAGPLRLARQGDCYSAAQPYVVRLCTARDEVVIEVSTAAGDALYSVSLDSFPGDYAPKLEDPRGFTLDEAMNRALTMDFGTRIEFQHVMQARHLAANAYLNLLPHLGANSILALATASDVVGLLGAVGDLAPFLLPTRWMQAHEAALASEAEQDALILMRGDAGVQLEGMAYAYSRDVGIQQDYREARASLEELRQRISSDEAAHRYPSGSADILGSLSIQLEAEAAELDLSVREQRAFLAQAMGFVSPGAVTELDVPGEPTPIEAATDLDASPVLGSAVERSFELRQLDFLIHAAQVARTATYFSWLDPAGDPSAELGFGLGEAVALEASKVDELRVVREQVQSTVLQKASNTVAEYNDSMEDHERSGRAFALADARLQRLVAAVQGGQPVEIFDLVDALERHLMSRIGLRNSEAVYRMSRAKLDRLLLRGYYSHLSFLPDPAGA